MTISPGPAGMKIDEIIEALSLGRDACEVRGLVAYDHRHLAAMQEPDSFIRDFGVLAQLLHEVLLSVICHIFAEHDRDVVQGYLIELVVRDL